MAGELRRVIVCSPRNAGWHDSRKLAEWKELGFQHAPDVAAAECQHDLLCGLLRQAGAEVVSLPAVESLTLDAVYAHDASLPTNQGIVLMHPGKKNRVAEARAHGDFYAVSGIPILGEIHAPGKSEAGDMVWLDSRTLLIGEGYRTNRAGIEQMRSLLSAGLSAGDSARGPEADPKKNVEVVSAPLPYGQGPSACLHLMSLMSVLDERTMLVDLPWLAVQTVELLKARGFRLIEIEYSERETLACNVLALGKSRVVAIEGNCKTHQRMREAGFEVLTFPGSQICINGAGGPTCLTRPLRRG